MGEAKYLQSYVVPVCCFEEREGVAHVHSLHGTAFFINDCGHFLTAAHVLKDAAAYAAKHALEVGLCGKGEGGSGDGTTVIRILAQEDAPLPYDVSIGATQYFTDSPLKLTNQEVAPWQDVATLGYPLSVAIRDEDESFWMGMKVRKGYVVRTTAPRDMTIGEHPDGLELSFLLSVGMSGSPIFTVPDRLVIGVGVGSFRSEEVEDSVVEVDEEGREFRETRLRIEQFGFAHALRGLLNWKPQLFAGVSLLRLSQTTLEELKRRAGETAWLFPWTDRKPSAKEFSEGTNHPYVAYGHDPMAQWHACGRQKSEHVDDSRGKNLQGPHSVSSSNHEFVASFNF